MRSSMRWYGTLFIKACLPKARSALHLKIAEEIERRSDNRLVEVAEVLAHHYSQTAASKKAFTYLSMAGSKSLGVYSLDEATTLFSAALALLDRDPDSASDDQVADFLVVYFRLLLFNLQITWSLRYLTDTQRALSGCGMIQELS